MHGDLGVCTGSSPWPVSAPGATSLWSSGVQRHWALCKSAGHRDPTPRSDNTPWDFAPHLTQRAGMKGDKNGETRSGQQTVCGDAPAGH